LRDLLVIVPSRGRPQRLAEMLDACLSLSEADTDVEMALDSDDPELRRYPLASDLQRRPCRVHVSTGPRNSLSGWTNLVAAGKTGMYRAFASLGDDHLPRTQGWDRLLLEALDKIGGEGIAYGNDLHQGEALPTAPVISAGIVSVLGWMCEPSLSHHFVDNVWRDLGLAADCLAYVPGVTVEHLHPDAGKAPADQVYAESAAGTGADREAYWRWRTERFAADAAKVRAVIGH
jgi:hypothetical protein